MKTNEEKSGCVYAGYEQLISVNLLRQGKTQIANTVFRVRRNYSHYIYINEKN